MREKPALPVGAVGDLPALADPAAAAQFPFPVAAGGDPFVFAAGPAEAAGVRVRAHEVAGEPCAGPGAQFLVPGSEAEVHAAPYALGRSLAAAALAMASSCASMGIGSVPTVPGRKSAIFSGVQAPSAA